MNGGTRHLLNFASSVHFRVCRTLARTVACAKRQVHHLVNAVVHRVLPVATANTVSCLVAVAERWFRRPFGPLLFLIKEQMAQNFNFIPLHSTTRVHYVRINFKAECLS